MEKPSEDISSRLFLMNKKGLRREGIQVEEDRKGTGEE